MSLHRRTLSISLLTLALAVGIAGCASRPSMEELESEAMRTGDWSEVEQRKRMDRQMGRVDSDSQCPSGESLLCRQKGEREECECVDSQLLRSERF